MQNYGFTRTKLLKRLATGLELYLDKQIPCMKTSTKDLQQEKDIEDSLREVEKLVKAVAQVLKKQEPPLHR